MFRRNDEIINLALPVVFLIALGLGLSFSDLRWLANPDSPRFIQNFLIDIVFLNITHNAFTVVMLSSLPEMRPWIQARGGSRRFFAKTAAIFVGLSIFFFVTLVTRSEVLFKIFLFANLVLPTQHAMAQSLGLSLLYNNQSTESGSRTVRAAWWERKVVLVYIVMIVLAVASMRTPYGQEYGSGWVPQIVESGWLIKAPVFIGISLVVLMLLYPASIRTKKVLFSLRYPLWGLSLLSPLALIATKVIHGLEYLFVYRGMSQRSKALGLKASSMILIAVVAVFAYFRLIHYEHMRVADGESASLLLMAVASISTAFSFLHYYLDREMFLMRHKINRETVGRLISPKA